MRFKAESPSYAGNMNAAGNTTMDYAFGRGIWGICFEDQNGIQRYGTPEYFSCRTTVTPNSEINNMILKNPSRRTAHYIITTVNTHAI